MEIAWADDKIIQEYDFMILLREIHHRSTICTIIYLKKNLENSKFAKKNRISRANAIGLNPFGR